jgi:cytochrome c oxidase subunit 2
MTGVHAAAAQSERWARRITLAAALIVLVALLAVVLRPLGGASATEIDLVARRPSSGGWSRERIVVNQGDRVRLRIRSEDVVHGFAIGRLGVDAGPIEPSKVVTVDFVADRPGEYTYYCTVWCDPNHPRMRGVLEVRAARAAGAAPAGGPGTETGVHGHANPERAAPGLPPTPPSARRGAPLFEARCASCHGEGRGRPPGPTLDSQQLWERSPAQAFAALVDSRPHGAATRGWSDQDRWNAVAYVWSHGTPPKARAAGEALYRQNCAACHGEDGRGDGPGGTHTPKKPADFTDLRRMLAGTGALYEQTIRRGGMGSGMPYWGNIFTEAEIRALVATVWSFSLGPLK